MFSTRARRHAATIPLLIATGVAVAACSSGNGSALATDDLRNAGDDCPVDVHTTLDEAHLGSAEVTEVEVTDATDGDVDTVLGRTRGVLVDCTISHAGRTIDVLLLASEEPAAQHAFAPLLQHALEIDIEALEALLDEIHATGTGQLAELPGDAPIAIGNIDVDDAESAVVVVEGDAGASRDRIDTVATGIVDELA